MKLAVIGSRSLTPDNIDTYMPNNITEIVSGGAKGVDICAAEYAKKNNIKLTEFLPEYSLYGKCAPIKRNDKIAAHADKALVFWDGRSTGTKYSINRFRKLGKEVTIIEC